MPAPLVFAQPGYEPLAATLTARLGGEAGAVERSTFPDGERYQRIATAVEERSVVIVGGTIDDAATLALYDLASAAVTYGAHRLSLVVPYFGYSTMERAVKPGEVVVAKNRARLLSTIPHASAGNRVLLLDLHSEGIPHYFEGLTAFHVYSKPVLTPIIARIGGDDFVLGSTDSGRAKWVESLANDIGVDAAVILKRRTSGSETRVTAVSAAVDGRTVVIYDDMIRTGGSLLGAARAYLDAGAAPLPGGHHPRHLPGRRARPIAGQRPARSDHLHRQPPPGPGARRARAGPRDRAVRRVLRRAPGVNTAARAARPRQTVRHSTGLYICGDHRDNASIQGAMVSGRRAAEALMADRRSARSTAA